MMEAILDILSQLELKLPTLAKAASGGRVIVGFDGFVDKVIRAVHHRDASGPHYYRTLSEFSDRIRNAAGKSCQIEMDIQKQKIGGNAPILSSALSLLGVQVTCLGSIEHPVFDPLLKQCNAISLSPPGASDCIEFEDGKLILSDLSVFEKYDWQHITKAIGLEKLKALVSDCGFIALVDWANIARVDSIWEGLLEDVLIPSGRKDFSFFFDLCDPSRKTPEEIDEVLDLISHFSHCGTVTLGLNENEANTIWRSLSGSRQTADVLTSGKFIHNAMNIDCLLIHPIDRTIVFNQRDIMELPGRLVKHPRIQTGGGDNLNAGFITARRAGFSMGECMVLGMAASGYYVQEGKSADMNGLLDYIKVWMTELMSEKPVRSSGRLDKDQENDHEND